MRGLNKTVVFVFVCVCVCLHACFNEAVVLYAHVFMKWSCVCVCVCVCVCMHAWMYVFVFARSGPYEYLQTVENIYQKHGLSVCMFMYVYVFCIHTQTSKLR